MTGVAFSFRSPQRNGVASRCAYTVSAAGELQVLEEDGSVSDEGAFGEGGLAVGEEWDDVVFRGAGDGGRAQAFAYLGDRELPLCDTYVLRRCDQHRQRLELIGSHQTEPLAYVEEGLWRVDGEPQEAAFHGRQLLVCPRQLRALLTRTPVGPRSRPSALAERLAA